MADRADELRDTAAQCLALSRSAIDPQTRHPAHHGPEALRYGEQSARDFEVVQREFNDQQMLPQRPQPSMQQQQQIQPRKD